MLSRPRSSTTAYTHFEFGHHVYEPTERFHPVVASIALPLSVLPSFRRSNIKHCRSASKLARSIERNEMNFPSGEKRGVLSAPGLVVSGSMFELSGRIR